MCKYGDFFLKLDVAEEIGIIKCPPTCRTYEIERLEQYNDETLGEYDIKFRHAATEHLEYDVFEISTFQAIIRFQLPYHMVDRC